MRLIDVERLEFRHYSDEETPDRYAILSHTWGEEEVTFDDFHSPEIKSKAGYVKIKRSCELAIQDGLRYVWIDTCCINKATKAELSMAINSMYSWYQSATVCYAYLSDVEPTEVPSPGSSFYKSRWFTRGWTLQELIAPKKVIFYAGGNWSKIGSKDSLQVAISRITRIPREGLLDSNVPAHSPGIRAKRVTWVAGRETTKVEDMAYCLFGILDVKMEVRYGEGKKAFDRLEMEVQGLGKPDGFLTSEIFRLRGI